MTVTAIYDMKKMKVGEIDLPDEVFNVPVKEGLIHQAVCAHLSNCRQGNASTKTRAEVQGTGKKPYKQKGTGRARHGSLRSPIFVGGGVTFGPRPRDWRIELPKKQKKAAMRMALTVKNKDGQFFVIDEFISKKGKTKEMAGFFKTWEINSSVIVTHEADEKTVKAVRNIPHVNIVPDGNVSVYDLIAHEHVLFTKSAVDNIVKRLGS